MTLINYKNVSYSDVLIYTNQIKDRQKEAFRLYDLLSLSNIQLINSQGISKADFFNLNLTLQKARVAFFNDRYSEANSSLNDFSVSFEAAQGNNISVSGIKAGVQNFFVKNWQQE